MRMHTPEFILAAGLLATLSFGLTTPARSMSAGSGNYAANSTICRQIVSQTEHALKLPIGIMQAISLAESEHWDKSSRSHFA